MMDMQGSSTPVSQVKALCLDGSIGSPPAVAAVLQNLGLGTVQLHQLGCCMDGLLKQRNCPACRMRQQKSLDITSPALPMHCRC